MMIRRKNSRKIAPLNTTSTADLSFILLVFFLVITSMDSDKGLPRQLPPEDNKEQTAPGDVKRSNIMDITVDGKGNIMVNGQPSAVKKIKGDIVRFVTTKAERQQHIIQLHIDKKAEYDTYFHVQHEITAAYLQLRNEYATKKFGKKYKQCSKEQRKECMDYYAQRISERIEGMQGKEVQP